MKRFNLTLLTLSFLIISSLLIFQIGCKKKVEDNKLPACNITNPSNGEEIEKGEIIIISVNANDSDGDIMEVIFEINNVTVSIVNNSPFTYEWNTSDLELGTYKILVTVVDNKEAFSSQEIKVDLIYTFTCGDNIADIDGNIYKTVQIGNQCWMKENLKTTKYAGGSSISSATGAGNIELNDSSKFYFEYEDIDVREKFGRLYSWAAVVNNKNDSDLNPSEVQGVCPDGWHIPSNSEWKELELFLGMSESEVNVFDWRGEPIGNKLKAKGEWDFDENANDSSGFTALPGGFYHNGEYIGRGCFGYWWSSTKVDSSFFIFRQLNCNYGNVNLGRVKWYPAFSVRCVKD